MDRAGFLMRLIAYVIDLFCAVIIFSAVFVGGLILIAKAGVISDPETIQVILFTVGLLFAFIYLSTEIVLAATPGKKLVGLFIAHENEQRASVGQLTIRLLAKCPALPILIVGSLLAAFGDSTGLLLPANVLEHAREVAGLLNLVAAIGYLLMFAAGEQALHDRISATAVYRGKRPKSGEPNHKNFLSRKATSQGRGVNELIWK